MSTASISATLGIDGAPPLPRSLAERFFAVASTRPGKVAVHCEDEAITYADLAARARHAANGLRLRGLRAGQAIGVALPNSLEFIVLMLAAAERGIALAPVNTTLPVEALHRAFEVASAVAVIDSEDAVRALEAEGAAQGDDPAVGDHLDQPYILTMTSGSTGDPKPIVLSQRTKWMRAWSAVALYGLREDDVVLSSTPLYHSLAERLVLLPLMLGATAVVMRRFAPAHWIATARAREVTFTICVSSQLGALVPLLREGEGVPSLRCVVSSSAALPDHVKLAMLEAVRFEFHECYGASEVAIVSNLHVDARRDKLSTVGTAIPGVEVRIRREDGSWAGAGEVGEICALTPLAFAGYLGQPTKTAQAMQEGFFRTGDLGRLDADGFLSYLGRAKELIITGGINVYPADVESAARAFPGVRDALACGLSDEALGEIVGLALVPEDRTRFDLKAFRRHCATRLADFQQPRAFKLMDALPLNPLGKIDRRHVKAHFYDPEGSLA
jgi:long-chain acyl-CoA synthetase